MHIKAILTGATFCTAIAMGSFWLGFREGAEVGLLVDAVPRGSVSLHQLEKLKDEGLTRNVITGLEADVDRALVHADRYERHLLYPVFEPIWGIPVASASRSLGRLAEHRRSHASPLHASALAAEHGPTGDQVQAEAVREVLQSAARSDLVITRMVEKYAVGATKP